MSVDQLVIFLPAAFLVALTPGANNLLAFNNGARAGIWRAAGGLCGRLAAFSIMITLVAFGLETILGASELAFRIIKWAGVCYLIYLAVLLWRAPVDTKAPPPASRLARREFLTAMGNPKAYLLFTAFLPQFVSGTEALATQLLLLGGLYLAVEATAALLWIGVGALAGLTAATARRRRLINRASALVLGLAALALSRSERPA